MTYRGFTESEIAAALFSQSQKAKFSAHSSSEQKQRINVSDRKQTHFSRSRSREKQNYVFEKRNVDEFGRDILYGKGNRRYNDSYRNRTDLSDRDNQQMSSSSDNYYLRSDRTRSSRSSSQNRRKRHSSEENKYDYRNPDLTQLPPPPDPRSTHIDYRENSTHYHRHSRRSDKHSNRRSSRSRSRERSRSSSRSRRVLRQESDCFDNNDDMNDIKWIHDRHSVDEPE